jgi:hypothetical protein
MKYSDFDQHALSDGKIMIMCDRHIIRICPGLKTMQAYHYLKISGFKNNKTIVVFRSDIYNY